MAQKICPGCGKPIGETDLFCPYCGTSTPQPAQPKTPPQTSAPYWSAPSNPGDGPTSYPQNREAPNPPRSSVFPTLLAEGGVGKGWITFLRVLLWIFFAASVIATLVYAGIAVSMTDGGIGVAILIVLGGVLTAFLTVAGGMVLLNSASNLYRIADNTAALVNLEKRKQ